MFLLLASGLARAAVDADVLRAMMVELAPLVAKQTGASLVRLPSARVATLPVLNAELAAAPGGGRLGADLLAYYNRGQVVLVADSLSRMLNDAGVPRDRVNGAVRCVVAHELVHAAQDELGLLPNTTEPEHIDALIEGSAEVLSAPMCQQRDRPFVEAMRGLDVLGSEAPEGAAFTYGYGAVFARQYIERYGTDALWGLLRQLRSPGAPTLTKAEIVTVAQAALPRGWLGWEGPRDAAAQLMPGGAEIEQRVGSPYELVGLDRPIVARAGLAAHAESGELELRIYAWSLDAPEMARYWIRTRQDAIADAGEFRTLVPLGRGPVGAPIRVPLRIGEVCTRIREAGKGWVYQEVWAAREELLVGVAVRSPRALDLRDAIGTLLDGPPDTYAPAAEARAILDRLGPT